MRRQYTLMGGVPRTSQRHDIWARCRMRKRLARKWFDSIHLLAATLKNKGSAACRSGPESATLATRDRQTPPWRRAQPQPQLNQGAKVELCYLINLCLLRLDASRHTSRRDHDHTLTSIAKILPCKPYLALQQRSATDNGVESNKKIFI